MLTFSMAWNESLLAEKVDILIQYWNDILTEKTLPTPNYMYRAKLNKTSHVLGTVSKEK